MSFNYPYDEGNFTIAWLDPTTNTPRVEQGEHPVGHACACDTLKQCVMCGSEAEGLVFCAACKEAFHQFRRNYFLRLLQEMDGG